MWTRSSACWKRSAPRLQPRRVGRVFEAHRSSLADQPVGLEDSTHPTATATAATNGANSTRKNGVPPWAVSNVAQPSKTYRTTGHGLSYSLLFQVKRERQ